MQRVILAVVGIVLLAGSSARAHHGYGGFFLDRTVSVEGTLQRVLFANPHVVLTVETRDKHTYTAEWRAAFQLRRMGVESTTLKIGDAIVLVGRPSRDPAGYRLALLTEVRRPLDGWAWENTQVR